MKYMTYEEILLEYKQPYEPSWTLAQRKKEAKNKSIGMEFAKEFNLIQPLNGAAAQRKKKNKNPILYLDFYSWHYTHNCPERVVYFPFIWTHENITYDILTDR